MFTWELTMLASGWISSQLVNTVGIILAALQRSRHRFDLRDLWLQPLLCRPGIPFIIMCHVLVPIIVDLKPHHLP